MSHKEPAQSLENELTIQALLAILRRRRALITRTIAVCFVLAALFCAAASRRYSATAEIQVQKSSSDGLGLESMMSSAGGDATDALDANITLQTQANILQSDTLALKVIEDLNLEHTRDFKGRFSPLGWALSLFTPAGPRDPVNAPLEQAPMRRTRALTVFAKNLTVKPVPGTRLISVSYLSTDPKLAAAVVNHLTQGLVDYTFQTRYNATTEASSWLSSQLQDLKKEAETLQARVVTLQKDSGVYSLGSDSTGKELAYSAILDRLQQSTASLTAATSNRILKGGLYEITRKGDPELISGLASSSMTSSAVSNSLSLIQSLRQQQSTLEAQIATDSSRLGSANPKLGDERASLASLNDQIKAEVSRIGRRVENDYRSAQLVEASLQGVYDKQREAASKLNDKAIEFMITKQEAESSRSLYENLNAHLKEAGVMEGLHSSNITVVDPGRVPAKPVKPNVPLYLALSLVGGAFLGGIGALFREATDDRIQSMEMVEAALATPILAVLPLLNGSGARSVASYLPSRSGPKQLPAAAEELASGRRLPAIDGPHTAFVESLRSLRTSLLLSRSGAPPKVILITSATEDEGKSTVSVNLAAVFAQADAKVLLIEADMRHPGLTRRFGYDRTGGTGLSSMLSGAEYRNIPTIEAFSELPNLRVLPSGPMPPYPAELLGSDRMQELVESWRGMYDFVIIDSPPLLAVTDAQILARQSDVTVLVARHGLSTRRSLERAYRKLVNDQDKVSVVLNGVSRDSVSYGEYYGYRGGSKYYTEN
ncbi:MAG: Tyrosine-protein kinase EpsD [Acidobacteriaceae bacterium]|nr:Tyrosine-protein kinase EpsD [Acidobacteriaceae bacterium]